MKRTIDEWTVEEVYKMRENISFPDYQRAPKLWKLTDKYLLIDSILIDMDIPKFYLNQISKEEYEVIDGQQRLWAIWEFLDNEYPYKTESKIRYLEELHNKRFKDFPKDIQQKILSFKLQITKFTNASEEYLRKLFVRLQFGLLLITGEKLNAATGKMKDFIFKTMVSHPFIEKIHIPNRRFAKQTLCAQICINSFSKANNNEFSRTRYEDLNYFFEEYSQPEGNDLKFFKERCDKILKVLDLIERYFGEKAKLLRNRSYILSIYLFVEEMFKTSDPQVLSNTMPELIKFIFILWDRLKEEVKAGFYRKNEELYRIESYLSNAPGEKYQIKNRNDKFNELFKFYLKNKKIKGD